MCSWDLVYRASQSVLSICWWWFPAVLLQQVCVDPFFLGCVALILELRVAMAVSGVVPG